MAKVLVEGYRVTKDGGGLWTGVVGGKLSSAGADRSQPPPKPPKGFSAIKPAKPQLKE